MSLRSLREQTSMRPYSGHSHVPPLRRQLPRAHQDHLTRPVGIINYMRQYCTVIVRVLSDSWSEMLSKLLCLSTAGIMDCTRHNCT